MKDATLSPAIRQLRRQLMTAAIDIAIIADIIDDYARADSRGLKIAEH